MKKIIFSPCVIVLSGLPLSGKTTLAERLIKISNLTAIDVDIVRNSIDESRKKDKQIKMLEPAKEKAVMANAYKKMCQQAEGKINKNIPVLMTGTFSRDEFKEPLKKLNNNLKNKNIPLKVFLLTVPDGKILRRIEKRKKDGSFSNIDSLEKYNWAKGIFKKINFAPIIEIDSSRTNYFKAIINDLAILI